MTCALQGSVTLDDVRTEKGEVCKGEVSKIFLGK